MVREMVLGELRLCGGVPLAEKMDMADWRGVVAVDSLYQVSVSMVADVNGEPLSSRACFVKCDARRGL